MDKPEFDATAFRESIAPTSVSLEAARLVAEKHVAFVEEAIKRALELGTDVVIVEDRETDPFVVKWTAHFDGRAQPGAIHYRVQENRDALLAALEQEKDRDAPPT